MPKGIIVVDVPESCGGCELMACDDFENRHATIMLRDWRHDDCPIRVLPEGGLNLLHELTFFELQRLENFPNTRMGSIAIAQQVLSALEGLVR